jgi:hypothetical protein
MSSQKIAKKQLVQTATKIADKPKGEKPRQKKANIVVGEPSGEPTEKLLRQKKEKKPAVEKPIGESHSKPIRQKKAKIVAGEPSGGPAGEPSGGPAGEPSGESTSKPSRQKKEKKPIEDNNINLANEFGAITITFGEIAENHAGMQKIGTELPTSSGGANGGSAGFSFDELQRIGKQLNDSGLCVCELVQLNTPDILASVQDEEVRKKSLASDAGILILRNGVNSVLGRTDGADSLFAEQSKLPVDTKALMRGRVVNKQARYNLCFSDFAQDPDYAQGRGRVINFTDVPITSELRDRLPAFLGAKADGLQGEGNYYYDVRKCGIGFHGDGERQIVVGTRLGAKFPLEYQWFYAGSPIGARVRVELNHGDIYIMSAKAVGRDWKRRTVPTLRHAAGADKYLTITVDN